MLESVTQNTDEIPAPKYRAILDNMYAGCSEASSGIAETAPAPLSVFPNPVGETLFIRADDVSEIRLFSASGLLLFTLPHVGAIPVGQLPAGMYFITAKTGSGVLKTARFIRF